MRICFVVDGIPVQDALKKWVHGLNCFDYAMMPFSERVSLDCKKEAENYLGGLAQKLALSGIFESYDHVFMCKLYSPIVPGERNLKRYLIFSMRKKPDCLEFLAFYSVYFEHSEDSKKVIADALRGFHQEIFS